MKADRTLQAKTKTLKVTKVEKRAFAFHSSSLSKAALRLRLALAACRCCERRNKKSKKTRDVTHEYEFTGIGRMYGVNVEENGLLLVSYHSICEVEGFT